MPRQSAPREFAVTLPTRDPRLVAFFLIAIPELLAFAAVFVALRSGHVAPALQPSVFVNGLIAVPMAVILAITIAIVFWAVQRRQIVLRDGVLDVTAAMFRRKLPITAFDLDKALVVNLDERKEWRPFLKSGGFGIPGLSAGWFRNRSFVKMFCLLTVRSHVLVLPELTGGATLLSAERPQQLLDALRETADASRRAS